MTNVPAITINAISKSFKSKKIFSNFCLTIEKGCVHAVIGANGSGKTTLLRLMTGLYDSDEGEILMSGNHGMLLENDYLYEDLSGVENIKLFGKYFGYDGTEKNYKAYCAQLDLTNHLDKRVSEYSKAMKRKLSLLIVVLIDSEIVLLDEPTSGVDPIARVEIRRLIDDLKGMKKTVVITSHDLSEVEKIADTVTMLKAGEICFNLPMDALKGQPLEAVFIKEGGRDETKHQ